ncbi:hypothetical protein SLA2020_412470 [Shorea laevis]
MLQQVAAPVDLRRRRSTQFWQQRFLLFGSMASPVRSRMLVIPSYLGRVTSSFRIRRRLLLISCLLDTDVRSVEFVQLASMRRCPTFPVCGLLLGSFSVTGLLSLRRVRLLKMGGPRSVLEIGRSSSIPVVPDMGRVGIASFEGGCGGCPLSRLPSELDLLEGEV